MRFGTQQHLHFEGTVRFYEDPSGSVSPPLVPCLVAEIVEPMYKEGELVVHARDVRDFRAKADNPLRWMNTDRLLEPPGMFRTNVVRDPVWSKRPMKALVN